MGGGRTQRHSCALALVASSAFPIGTSPDIVAQDSVKGRHLERFQVGDGNGAELRVEEEVGGAALRRYSLRC